MSTNQFLCEAGTAGKKIISNNLTDQAIAALQECIDDGGHADNGFLVAFEGASVQVNVPEVVYEVDSFDELLEYCCNISKWEYVLDQMGVERCSKVLNEVQNQCFTIKLKDIIINNFDPSQDPTNVDPYYGPYAEGYSGTCRNISVSCGRGVGTDE